MDQLKEFKMSFPVACRMSLDFWNMDGTENGDLLVGTEDSGTCKPAS